MAYLGRELTSGNYLKLDDISSQFDGVTKRFNLTSGGQAFYPGSAFSILVSLGGVLQEPEAAFQIDQNQIVFASAPSISDDFFCIVLGLPLAVNVPANSTISGEQLSKPLNYNNGHLYFDSENNRLGINSTTPRQTLDVRGDAIVSGGASIGGNLTVTGNVSVAGTVTYEDVSNVDSVGIITARTGIRITSGGLIVTAGVSTFAGITTHTAELFGTDSDRKSTRLNSSHVSESRMPSFA